jgi:putative acetyltransferase
VEGRGDAGAIAGIHTAAFGEDSVADLVVDLCATIAPDDRLSLVAELEGRVIGHVLFTRNLLDAPARLVPVRVLSPIAVEPAHQRRGIGAGLIRQGLDMLADDHVPAVFLEGDPAYYARFGFLPAGPLGFRKPSLRIPDPAFQVLRLPAYADWMTGTLVYNEAFWRHDAVGLREAATDE